jgi:hypothetical protein
VCYFKEDKKGFKGLRRDKERPFFLSPGQSGERFGCVEVAQIRKNVQPRRHEAHEGIHEEGRKISGLSDI